VRCAKIQKNPQNSTVLRIFSIFLVTCPQKPSSLRVDCPDSFQILLLYASNAFSRMNNALCRSSLHNT